MTTPPAIKNIAKYAQHAPRYTSYPTALKFDHVEADILQLASEQCGAETLSVYLHIPFCETLCYYCGCNKIVTRHNHKADEYLDYLGQEIRVKKPLYQGKKIVAVHLGGGSPSFLSSEQQTRLMALITNHFDLSSEAEISIELDPRNVTTEYLSELRALGYNRVSFGVQDTNIDIQTTINRVQSTAHIASLVFEARSLGFSSVNLDLIYGLPKQTLSTFKTTLSATKAMSPDRISLFSYAHMPERFAAQRKIPNELLPTPAQKAALHQFAAASLCETGYVMIGLDHFAKPTDTLAIAKRNNVLHRNFQGYTTYKDTDLLGLGVSAISTIGNAYGQNPKVLQRYYAAIDDHKPLAERGITLTRDDRIRRDVIMSLMCNLYLDKAAIAEKFTINFDAYFCEELTSLSPLQDDGLINLNPNSLSVPSEARIYIRVICAKFDAYLRDTQHQPQYSTAI